VADRNGPTMLARIGVMEALNANVFASSIRNKRSRIGGVAGARSINRLGPARDGRVLARHKAFRHLDLLFRICLKSL